MMLKSKSTTNIRPQTDSSYRQYGTLCTSIIEQKQDLQNHRNKSPAGNIPQCHWWKYQKQYPKIWIILKEIKFYQKMIPKNPGIAQKGTQKSGSNPKKVPKIMAHSHIMTYASYPPPHGFLFLCLYKWILLLRQMNRECFCKMAKICPPENEILP